MVATAQHPSKRYPAVLLDSRRAQGNIRLYAAVSILRGGQNHTVVSARFRSVPEF